MSNLPPPICLALAICDHLWVDPSTNKRHLMGLFSKLTSPAFPIAQRELTVYVCMTEGHGTLDVRLRVSDVDDELPPVYDRTINLPFPNPHDTVETAFILRDVTFDEPRDYRVQLFVGGEFIAERRLVVQQIQFAG